MFSASVYITACTAKNRLMVRLRRLREPRYLIGAIAGAVYLYFVAFSRGRRPGVRQGRGRNSDNRPPFEMLSALQVTGMSLAGLAMFVSALLAWLLPVRSGLLEFSAAETEFLFPAPVTRRQLLVHRIIRSQIGSLIASVFIAVFATPISGLARVRLTFGLWTLLVTVRIYFAAVSLTRARVRSPIAAVRRGAWLPIGLLLAGAAVVGVSVVRQMLQPVASVTDFAVHLSRATAAGLPHAVLWPFIAILRPPLETTVTSFVLALGSSLLVLAAVVMWLLSNDAVFDAVAGDARESRENAVQARTATVRAGGWTLPLTGRLEWALLWKNAMQTIRAGNVSAWRYIPPAIGALIGILGGAAAMMGAAKMRGPAAFISVLGAIVAGTAVIFGPQMMRTDLRTDFEHLDLLKTWPVRGSDLIRGEMMWPALVVSAIAWLALLAGVVFSGMAIPEISLVDRWSFAIAAMLAAPALIAAQYAVNNAATVFFPAWVPLGTQRTRGIDAMGQRLVLLAAIVLSLLIFALPGAAVSGLIWFVFRRIVGSVILVPAAVVFAGIVLLEVLVVTELLGPAYERIDLTSVERAE